MIKGYNRSCNKYKKIVDQEEGNGESEFYLNPNGTNLFLKPLVSLIIGDSDQAFLSQVGEYLSKYTAMDITDGVNCTVRETPDLNLL